MPWNQVKRLFADALARPEGEREAFLRAAEKEHGGLVQQVRDLLAHHETRTLIESPPRPAAPRPTTRTLESRWWHRRRARWALVLGLFLTGAGIALWLRAITARSVLESAVHTLDSICATNATSFEAAVAEWSLEASRIARYHEAEFLAFVRAPDDAGRAAVAKVIGAVVHPDRYEAYAIFDARGPLLAASSQFRPGLTASSETMRHSVGLDKGEVSIFPAGRNRLVAEWDLEGELLPDIHLLTPIQGRGGNTRALLALVKRANSGLRQLEATHFGRTGELLLFSPDGLLLGNPRFVDTLLKAGLVRMPKSSRALPVVYLRDPGRPLQSGKPGDVDAWPETLPVRLTQAAIRAQRAADPNQIHQRLISTPYRDYRGEEVIGAWRYLPAYGVAMVAKADRAELLGALDYFDWVFWGLILLSLAGPTYLLLLGPGLATVNPYQGQFGPYTLLEKIGEGGTGEVYLASHSLLRRPAAVKILRRDRLTTEMLGQFEREVQLASHLRHPNTIEIYDFGMTPEGSPYCAMEYLAGHDLAFWVRRGGPMSSARVRHIARQICGSLREAHAAGLLHRDLKPANIMLCQLGGEVDFVKLLDFGLAKPVTTHDEASTSPAALAGTPYYIAPERLEGRGAIDARSDFYSLGVLMYYLLTGAMPYDETAGWVQSTLSGAIVPLRRRGVIVPAAFEELIGRCLSRDPAFRPPTAGDVLEVLETLEPQLPWSPVDAIAAWADFPAAPST